MGAVRSLLDNQEMAYATQVIEYNKVVVQGVIRPSLVDKFSRVTDSLNDKVQHYLIMLYIILIYYMTSSIINHSK
jgi:hypothetical protein